jgi:hypothetical protein
MSNINHYSIDLHQEVLIKCAEDSSVDAKEDAFVEFVTDQLSDHNEADFAEVIRPASRWNAIRTAPKQPSAKINAWALSGDGSMLDLYVAAYKGEGIKYDLPLSEVIRHFDLLKGFLARTLSTSSLVVSEDNGAFEVIGLVRDSRAQLSKVRLILITDGIVKGDISELIPFKISDISVSYVIWDVLKLSRLQPGEQTVIELDFEKINNGPIGCIATEDSFGEYRTFLAYMPAPLLGRIYNEYGQRLMERNVRAFLQTKTEVNSGIQKTLREEPERFLAYNNGLCCTASEINVEIGQNGLGLIKSVEDFQIVNGGQTTASIFHAIKNKIDVSGVVVQMKLTVVSSPEAVEKLVPLISKFANSQNKVAYADFAANGNFHIQMERISRDKWAPGKSDLEISTRWFYERARGSYEVERAKAHTPSKKREFDKENPRSQRFTKTDLAKFELSWMGHPDLVSKGAQKNFAEYARLLDENGEPNVTPEYFHQVIARALFFKGAERIVSKLDLGGYRANIVAYSVAWLAEKSDFRIDLDEIWRKQGLSDDLCKAIEAVARAAHKHFATLAGAGGLWKTNIGENTKKRPCWEQFRSLEIDIPSGWKSKLSTKRFLSFKSDAENLSQLWNEVREGFQHSPLTTKALEISTGKNWPVKMNTTAVASIVANTYDQMIAIKGIGEKTMRLIIEFFAAAKEQN